MQSDDHECHSDSFIEKSDDKSSNIQLIYKDITDSLNEIIDRNPLFNDLPLSNAIQSRIIVLTDLYRIILNLYEDNINRSWFSLKLSDLKEAIYGIAKLVDNMKDEYEILEYSTDTAARYYIRMFPSSLYAYLNDARRNIIKTFNEFITDDDWLRFKYTKNVEMELPLSNKLKIPEDLI